MNALAVLLLSVVPTADKASSIDELNKALTELRSGDSKLKSIYSEIVQGYKKTDPLISKIKDINNDTTILKTQLLNITGTRARDAQARANLRNRINDLEKNKAKLEKEYKTKVEPLQEQETAFKEEEKKAWEAANKTLPPLLYALKIEDDRKAHEAVLAVFDLFVFDDHKDAPSLKLGSILDQEVLIATSKCLATGGTKHLASIKRMFERTTAMKYAAVLTVKEIGPEVAKLDKEIPSSLHAMKADLIKNKKLEKAERDARMVIVDKAIESTKP